MVSLTPSASRWWVPYGNAPICDNDYRTGVQSGTVMEILYMIGNGTVNFGIYGGGTQVISSINPLNDGLWHLSPVMNGSISDVAIYPSPLTQSQVSNHFNAAGTVASSGSVGVRLASVQASTATIRSTSAALSAPVTLSSQASLSSSKTVRLARVTFSTSTPYVGSSFLSSPVTFGGNLYNASIRLQSPVTMSSGTVSAGFRFAGIQGFAIQNVYVWNGSAWVLPSVATFLTSPVMLTATGLQISSGATFGAPVGLSVGISNAFAIGLPLVSPVQMQIGTFVIRSPSSGTGFLTLGSVSTARPYVAGSGSMLLSGAASSALTTANSGSAALTFVATMSTKAVTSSYLRALISLDARALSGIGGSQSATASGTLILVAKAKAFPTPVSAVGIPRFIKSGTALISVSSYVRVHGLPYDKIYQTGKTAPKVH